MPFLMGFAGLFVIWVVVGLASRFNLATFVLGEDGKPSTSKLQLLLWTSAVVWGYIAIYWVRVEAGNYAAITTIPTNLLISMGISGASAVSAKAIATNAPGAAARVAAARAAEVANPAEIAAAKELAISTEVPLLPGAQVSGLLQQFLLNQSGMLSDSSGKPDLGKVQILVWTLIALGIFLTSVVSYVHQKRIDLPEIDRTLMILMGLGHSIYVGQKIAEN